MFGDKVSSMQNLTLNNMLNKSLVSQHQAYQYIPEPENKSMPVKVVNENSKSNKMNTIIPATLLTAGGILLYYGFKAPTKTRLFRTHVNNRLYTMEKKVQDFNTFIKNMIDTSFESVNSNIEAYKNSRTINFSESISHIKMLNAPNKVINAQDLAFEAITNHHNEYNRTGPSDMGIFSSNIEKVKSTVAKKIEAEKDKLKLELGDFAHLPAFKDGSHSDIVEAGEDKLITMQTALMEQIEEMKFSRLNLVTKNKYRTMAEYIIKARELKNQAKENVINVTFDHIRTLLKLDKDFIPSYFKVPGTENFEKLTAAELKPRLLPLSLRKTFENNIFLDTVQKKDFGNLTYEDIKAIFYSMPYDNNLKDLGFLIDRLRLRQATLKARRPDIKNSYDVIIPKLEYLSNKLHQFGRNELIEKAASENYNNMNVEKRRASLYYISNISRRLGYESLEKMDIDFAKNSPAYEKLNIREYMKIIKNNPDLYFF